MYLYMYNLNTMFFLRCFCSQQPISFYDISSDKMSRRGHRSYFNCMKRFSLLLLVLCRNWPRATLVGHFDDDDDELRFVDDDHEFKDFHSITNYSLCTDLGNYYDLYSIILFKHHWIVLIRILVIKHVLLIFLTRIGFAMRLVHLGFVLLDYQIYILIIWLN